MPKDYYCEKHLAQAIREHSLDLTGKGVKAIEVWVVTKDNRPAKCYQEGCESPQPEFGFWYLTGKPRRHKLRP